MPALKFTSNHPEAKELTEKAVKAIYPILRKETEGEWSVALITLLTLTLGHFTECPRTIEKQEPISDIMNFYIERLSEFRVQFLTERTKGADIHESLIRLGYPDDQTLEILVNLFNSMNPKQPSQEIKRDLMHFLDSPDYIKFQAHLKQYPVTTPMIQAEIEGYKLFLNNVEFNLYPHGRARNFWLPVNQHLVGKDCPCFEEETAIVEDKGEYVWRAKT